MLKKPTQKTITNAAITTASFVAGAKIGDGIAAVVPESMSAYKRIGLGVVGIIAAASISGTNTSSEVAKSALLGMAAQQIVHEVTDQLTTSVAVKDSSSVANKFINAVVGHQSAPVAALSAAWDSGTLDPAVWDRPLIAEPVQVAVFNPDLLV